MKAMTLKERKGEQNFSKYVSHEYPSLFVIYTFQTYYSDEY